MRRFSAVLIVAVAAASTAAVAEASLDRTAGGAQLSLERGHGFAKVVARGTFLGRVKGRGRIRATKNVRVRNFRSSREVSENVRSYRGRGMTFFVAAGSKWRLRIRGSRIFGSGRYVRGCLWLDAEDDGRTGKYRIGASNAKRWPRSLTGPLRVGSAKC